MSNTSSHPISELQELQMVEENPNAATNYYAGPFCSCADYSCPRMENTNAQCVNLDLGTTDYAGGRDLCDCGDHLCGGTKDGKTDCDHVQL